MSTWFAHPLSGWIAAATILALAFQITRFVQCRSALSRLHARLQQVVSGDQSAAESAFADMPLGHVRVGWASFRAGLSGGYSSPLSHLSWTPRLWTAELLGLHRTLWLAPVCLCLSPVLAWHGFSAGYQRLGRELAHLSALQVWEGSRAVYIVRHAINSFTTWAEPGFRASLLALVAGLMLALTAALTNWLLRRQLERVQIQLGRIFPPLPEGGNLQKIEEQLARMHELLLKLTGSE